MKRHLSADDHVVLHRRNRNIVAGTADRVPMEWHQCFLLAGMAIGCLIFVIGSGIAIVTGDRSSFQSLGWLAVGTVFLGAAVLCTALCAATTVTFFRDRARFEQHGRLVTGEVIEAEKFRTKSSLGYPPGAVMTTTALKIAYRFLTLESHERTGCIVLRELPRRIPSSGDHLAILYADDSPRRTALELPEDGSPKGGPRSRLAHLLDNSRVDEIVL